MTSTNKNIGVWKALAGISAFIAIVLSIGFNAQAGEKQKWPGKLELIGLLKQGDYDSLEWQLTSAQRAFEIGEVEEWRVNRVYFAFAYADPGLESRFREWIAQIPKSYNARLARGVYYHHLAMLSRGELASMETPREQFVVMNNYLRLSLPDLDAALVLNRRLSTAYIEQMMLARATGNRRALFVAYGNGTRAIPNSIQLHWTLLNGLDPKWGGSRQLYLHLREYVKQQSASSDLHKSLVTYFDLYEAGEHFRAGRKKKALAMYDVAIAKGEYAFIRYRRSQVLYGMGRYNDALTDLKRALEINPEYERAIHSLAESMDLRQEWDKALGYYDLAIGLDPYHPDLLTGRARVLARLGRLVDAEADLERAVYYGNFNPDVHAARGRYLLKFRKDLRASADAFKISITLSPFVLRFRQPYLSVLSDLGDCEYVPAMAKYLELCLKRGKCDRDDAVHLSNLMGHYKIKQSCPQRLDMSHLRYLVPDPPPVTGQTDVRSMELLGLRLGDTIQAVRDKLPTANLPENRKPITRESGQQRSPWNYVSDDRELKIQLMFSRRGKLMGLTSVRNFAYEGSLESIRDRLTKLFGKPDTVRIGKTLHMNYLRVDPDGSVRNPLARLTLFARLLDTPARRCKLPDRLRFGSTVVYLTAQLTDFAAIKENRRTRTAAERRRDLAKGKREAEEMARSREKTRNDIHHRPKLGLYDGCDRPERTAADNRVDDSQPVLVRIP